jgi:hypothetical protein
MKTAIAPAGAALVAVLLLGGCSLLPPLPFLPDSGSSSDDGGSSSNGDSDIEDNPFLEHEVPDTFPSDVPLPDLDIVFALDVGTGWNIVYKSDDIQSDHARITQMFEDEGWEVLSDTSQSDTTFGIYDNDGYQAQVTGSSESNDYDGPVISFLVVAKE